MRRGWRKLLAALAILTGPSVAAAGDSVFDDLLSGGYTVTVGSEARVTPRWVGSDHFAVLPVPLFDVRRAGTPEKFHSPRDGIGVGVYSTQFFTVGPVVELEFARRVKSDPALTGMGDLKLAVLAGGFVDFWPTQWLRARTELKVGVHGHHGFVADQAIDLVVPFNQWTFSGGPRMTFADTTANGRYFSISTAQSEASGLPVYDAKAGVRSLGAGAQAKYRWNKEWATHAFVEFDRLVGPAANSPLVYERGDPNQRTVGAGVTYSFDIGR